MTTMPPPDIPAELFGGPHDGTRLAIYPHTHEVLMPDHARYAYLHARLPRSPRDFVTAIFQFQGHHPTQTKP